MEGEEEIISQCEFLYSPEEVLPDITATECDNLGATTGLDGTKQNNCDDLNQLVCDIKQEVDAINVPQAITIAANDASKCKEDNLPTLASIWSRILRYAQATTCILCDYDPRVGSILQTGRYPQILMGGMTEGGYPRWVDADEVPTMGSMIPVTSGGVYDAIEEAVMGVWHLWEEEPEFDYFAQTLDSEDDNRNLLAQTKDVALEEGKTALVASQDGKTSLLYEVKGGKWEFVKEFGPADRLVNFAATHINEGAYATKGVYYFDGTWQVIDADFSEIEKKLEQLEQKFEHGITSGDETNYLIMTRPTLEEAEAVECTEGKSTIVLVTG